MKNDGFFIQKLSVKNFATFDDQTIQYDTGFNTIVGETGSGKSLILDALQLILGSRSDKKLIRRDCDYAIIECTFTSNDKDVFEYFNSIGFPYDENEVVIKRIIYKSGKSKSYINYQSCSLSSLSEFSKRFIDLVGQFENQKLLSEDYQIKLLDNYSQNQKILFDYQDIYSRLQNKRKQLVEREEQYQQTIQRLDYLDFQINEIEKLDPSQEREEELIHLKDKLQNLEQNKQNMDLINNLFEGSDDERGILSLLNILEKNLNSGLLNDEDTQKLFTAKEALIDISYKINQSLDLDYDEIEFEDVLTELDSYQKLKRKFGVDTQGLVDTYQSFQKEKESINHTSNDITQIKKEISEYSKHANDLAMALHARRIRYAQELSKALTKEVESLKMKGATINIDLRTAESLSKNGLTLIEFKAETNPGEGFFKIKDIASGGELSRILLALRTLLSSKDSISVFLFDEIDTGIGGETANTVGKALSKVSKNSQVIAITHLPQIAKYSDNLIKVQKEIINKEGVERTISTVNQISKSDLDEELISMTGLKTP